jgi:hypothetical protein
MNGEAVRAASDVGPRRQAVVTIEGLDPRATIPFKLRGAISACRNAAIASRADWAAALPKQTRSERRVITDATSGTPPLRLLQRIQRRPRWPRRERT